MYENNFPNKRFRITLGFLKQFISKKDRILDLGTINPFSDILKKEGYKVTNTEGEDLDLDTTIVKKDGLLGRTSFFGSKFCGTIVGRLLNYPALLLGKRLLTRDLIITPPATGLFELIKLHHFTNLWHHNGLA